VANDARARSTSEGGTGSRESKRPCENRGLHQHPRPRRTQVAWDRCPRTCRERGSRLRSAPRHRGCLIAAIGEVRTSAPCGPLHLTLVRASEEVGSAADRTRRGRLERWTRGRSYACAAAGRRPLQARVRRLDAQAPT